MTWLVVALPAPLRAAVDVSLDNTRGTCAVRGVFTAPVPAVVAWSVLTDYDSLSRFVSSMQSSRLEMGPTGQRVVRQDAVARALLVRRHVHVLLELNEEPGIRIAFRDILGRDFRHYDGAWQLSATAAGTTVEYRLSAEPRDAIARAMCRGMMKNLARELLEQVRDEMVRRASAPP